MRTSTRSSFARIALLVALGASLTSPIVSAQRRGGGGGGGSAPAIEKTRFEVLTDAFTLDGDSRKATKTVLDQAYKEAAPIRAALEKTRAAIAVAIQAGKPQPDVDAAVSAYAAEMSRMADSEMKALAQVIQPLSEEQRKNQPAISTAFYVMRGAFIDDKKWDVVPTRPY